MIKKKIARAALVAAVVGGTSFAFVAPAQAQSEPVGRRCEFSSVTDPTVENGGTQIGYIRGGPIGQPDNPTASVEIICTIQVGSNIHNSTSNDTYRCTDGPSMGTDTTFCGPVIYPSPPDQPVYLCTEVRISGKETFYWNAINPTPTPPAPSGSWSHDPNSFCNEAIRQEILPGPLGPVLDLIFNTVNDILIDEVDPRICPILAVIFPPEGDIPPLWDCPPYGL